MNKKIKPILAVILSILMLPQYAFATDKIETGDYVQLGTYRDKPLIWRSVGEDENGTLMLANQIICYKSFDAAEKNSDNSRRKTGGSNLWSTSNIRCWLNSENEHVDYICGNPPSLENVWNSTNAYENEAGFLTNFTAEEKKAIKEVTLKTPLNGLDVSLSNGKYKTATFDAYLNKSNVETQYQNTTDSMFLLDCAQLDMVKNNFDDGFCYSGIATTAENEHMAGSNMTEPYFLRTPNADAEWSPDRIFTMSSNTNSEIPFDIVAEAYMSLGIRPAFYLNNSVEIKSGKGTMSEPYILSTISIAPVTRTPISVLHTLEVENGKEIKISIDGKAVEFDAKPFIDENDRTLVPVRAVSEMLNAKVDWDSNAQTVMITQNGKIVKILIGSDIMTVDRNSVKMDTKAVISEERTYIPVRYVAEALGLSVNWVE